MIGSQINKLVLTSLESGDKYGLEIIKDVENFTKGKVVIKQPSLYSALQRLEKKGIISSFWQDSDIGGRRHYYSLTNYGKHELEKTRKAEPEPDFSVDENLEVVQEKSVIQNKQQNEATTPQQPNINKTSSTLNENTSTETKSKKIFEQYDPKNEPDDLSQSFTQKMREYSEPDSSIFENPSPVIEPKQEVVQEQEIVKQPPLPTTERTENYNIEQSKSSKDEINYKDILGDLDADLPDSNEIKPTSTSIFVEQKPTEIKQTEEQKPKRVQSEYSKQIAKILSSSNTTETEHKTLNQLNSQQSKDLMEEINRRYKLNYSPSKQTKSEQVHTIATNTVGYNHIKQDKITVKPYSKTEDIVCNTKNFLDINKFNLCRAGILTIIFLIEIIISYFVFKDNGTIYQPHAFLYILYAVLAFVYLGVMMIFTLRDLGKKVRIKDINWAMNLFYRFILTAVLTTFVLAICLCIGMTSLLEPEYFTLWYIPILAIANILVSWIIGILIFATKAFRV